MIIKAKGKEKARFFGLGVMYFGYVKFMIGVVYWHNVLELFTLLLSWVSWPLHFVVDTILLIPL